MIDAETNFDITELDKVNKGTVHAILNDIGCMTLPFFFRYALRPYKLVFIKTSRLSRMEQAPLRSCI